MKRLTLLIICLFSIVAIPTFAQDAELKIIHGPYIQNVDSNEVTVVWVTNKKAVSWVEVAPEGNKSFYAQEWPKYYQTLNGTRTIGCIHKIRIQNLEKNKAYRYRIFSKEVLSNSGYRVLYGNVASTNVFSSKPLKFKTLDNHKHDISFYVVNDIHEHQDTLKALLKDVKYGKTDFVFFNGDMVSSMLDENQFFGGFMDMSVKMFAGEVPVVYARGNHETRGPLCNAFSDYFVTNNGKLYYSFRVGPVYFIVLDSGEDKPDSDIEYSELACYDEYRTEQKEWLEKIVQSPDFKSAPFRIALIHIPPLGTDWHGALDIRHKMLPVLNSAGINLMLCGHTHAYRYIEPDQSELKFPILINGTNTALKVDVDANTLIVRRLNTKGVEMNKFTFQAR